MKTMKDYGEIIQQEHIANLTALLINMQVGDGYYCVDHWGKIRQVVAVAATYSGTQYALYCVRNTNDAIELHIGKIISNEVGKVILNTPDFEFARGCKAIFTSFNRPILSTESNIELMLRNYNDMQNGMRAIDPIVHFSVVDSSIEISAI